MNIAKAIDAPRIHDQWYPDLVYSEKFALSSDVIKKLIKMGYHLANLTRKFRILGMAEGIMIDNKNHLIYGASDPRGQRFSNRILIYLRTS